jgi:hypothetical protein
MTYLPFEQPEVYACEGLLMKTFFANQKMKLKLSILFMIVHICKGLQGEEIFERHYKYTLLCS